MNVDRILRAGSFHGGPLCSRCFSTASATLPSLQAFRQLQDPTSPPGIIVSRADQIHFNLALETYLLDFVRPRVPVFFWWRNNRNVVIGRYQNPWQECNLERMSQDGVDLARRLTGGGAVYQDLGNSCFTYLVPSEQFHLEKNNGMILRVLRDTFSINAEASGRNDLTVDGKKFSGAAFRTIKDPLGVSEGLSLHHGTMLISTDFSALQTYLTPHKLKLQSKGVASVAARVANLSQYDTEITHYSLEKPLTEEFLRTYSTEGTTARSETIVVDRDHAVTQDPEFQRLHQLLRDWTWRFGSTPRFSHKLEKRFDWGLIDLNIDVRDGKIQDVKIFTDTLHADVVPSLENSLAGVTYDAKAVAQTLDRLRSSYETTTSEVQALLADFRDWLCSEIRK